MMSQSWMVTDHANTDTDAPLDAMQTEIVLKIDELLSLDFDSGLGQLDCVTCMRTIDNMVLSKSIAFELVSFEKLMHVPQLKPSVSLYLTQIWSAVITDILRDFLCYGISVIAFIADDICMFKPQVLNMQNLRVTMKTDPYDQRSYTVHRQDQDITNIVVLEHYAPHSDGTLTAPMRLLRNELLIYQTCHKHSTRSFLDDTPSRIVVQV
jgi:hypothetical protein